MSTHLLDTNACIALITGRCGIVRERFEQTIAAHASIATSSIVAYELWYGVSKSTRVRENTNRLMAFLSGPIDVLPFAAEDAVIAGSIRNGLERLGTPIGSYDTLIAAQAMRLGIVLVTANVGEFERVVGLRIENWTRA